MSKQYDLVIIGGGLVGGSLASALAGTDLRVGVVEAVPIQSDQQPSYDERVIALSWGSRCIFQGMGLWSDMEADAEPIRRIHISDKGGFGFTRLSHEQEGVEALGYVAPARQIGHAIAANLAGVDTLCPARLLGFRVRSDRIDVEVLQGDESRVLSTRLLVAADGGESAVRRRLGLSVRERSYGQDAVISTVTPDRPLPGVAFERFTETGPLALLPMTEGRFSLVWTTRQQDTARLLDRSDKDFLGRLQDRFGYRMGRFTRLGRRIAYPLKLRTMREPVSERLVFIGNAAHTLHPVAGQGFNLGLRDAATLAQLLVDAVKEGGDPGGQSLLDLYRRRRIGDQRLVAAATDTLARMFANPLPPVRWARDLAMLGLDLAPGPRHLLARRFMGLGGPLSGLASGIPLGRQDG